MKRRAFTLLALSAGTALATHAAHAADVLTIGAIGPLTGAGSAWGLGLVGGVELATEEINAQGGLKVGDKSYQVKVLAYDSQYTAAGVVSAYTRLVTQDGVKFIIGPISSVGTVAIKDMVEQNKTIIFTGGTSRKVIDANTKFLFRPFSTPTEYGGALVRWLGESEGRFDEVRDAFVTRAHGGEEEVWAAETVVISDGSALKVYPIGAGSWVWNEASGTELEVNAVYLRC